MMMSEFGGFTPSDKLREVDKLEKIIEIEPDISDEIEKIFKKKGIEMPEMFKPPKVFEIPSKITPVPFDPFPFPQPQPAPQPAPTQPTPEIDTKLQFLLSAIPIAHPGNIITSEYHNALRDAVRALASRIGLNVNPAAEFKILTFAPDFKPVPDNRQQILRWEVSLNNATLPPVGEGDDSTVIGGLQIQLPDNAEIFQMIVRGERQLQPKSPQEFQVSLNRQKFGKDKRKQRLISMDLKDVQKDNRETGYFEAKESIKLSDEEAGVASDRSAASLVSDRKIVNNESWLYFVTAEWTGSANVAKFEIYSIQIICRV